MLQRPQAEQKGPDFLNLGQAADFIHLSRGTLNKLIKNGELKVTFIGSAKRISKAQLIQFMADKAI
jgi:excisionase family DNA binding protein